MVGSRKFMFMSNIPYSVMARKVSYSLVTKSVIFVILLTSYSSNCIVITGSFSMFSKVPPVRV